jgi:outer membrane protein assembly factor BamB
MNRSLCLSLVVTALVATARADWPMFIGDGDRTPPQQGLRLVDHLDDAPMLWELEHHMGVGKGLYPGHLKLARALGIDPFYGGASSPIVADGMVYVSYYRPDGKVPARVEPWRTVDDPEQYLPKWFFSVTANDILLAVDAETGEIRWEAVEMGKGHNRLGHKRGHWCVSPAVANGRVFSMGTAGLLYAYDAKSGKKLWETVAEPSLQAQRDEYLQSRRLCWKASEKSSLVVVGNKVIVPHGGLTAFNVRTGELCWQIENRILSEHATPVIWTHNRRDYLVVNDGRGSLRLIDSDNGAVLVTHEGLGEQIGTVNLTDDLIVLNSQSKKATDQKKNGLFGIYRLSSSGLDRLWTLPDKPAYRHCWTLDRGAERRAAIQNGRVYLVVGIDEDQLVVADVQTGRILSDQVIEHGQAPYPMEDRLLVYHDRAHTDPVRASWWSLADRDDPVPLHGQVGFGPRTITGYEVPLQWPYVDGRLYVRTLRGLACFDLRQPAETERNRTLRMAIPARVAGFSEDLMVTLVQRDGKLTHGGFRQSRRLHAVGVSEVRWDGRNLRGILRIDVNGYRQFDDYKVDAALDQHGVLTGTITRQIQAFRKPLERGGPITAISRQPNWMPFCTHVLQLHDAAIQQGGREGRLLLFVTVEDGTLKRMEAVADQTTQSRPVLEAEQLQLDRGRLTGVIRVCYRADQWAQPHSENGDSAAATYTIDAKLTESGKAGSYQGTYGITWCQTETLGSW